jgi:ferric-dicitrate binding protein FerR (iron transport regulator)
MDDLLIKYVLGEATPQEVAQIEQWLQADAANRRKLEQYKSLWAIGQQTAAAARPGSEDAREAWRQLSARLEQHTVRDAPMASNQSAAPRWIRLAAVMTGLLLLSAAGYVLLTTNRPRSASHPTVGGGQQGAGKPATEIPPTLQSKAMPVRYQAIDTLPDGTVVTLNRQATLELTGKTAEKGLKVRLHGEAFFQVPPHSSRFFVVQVGNTAVTVLGTTFELNEQGNSIELVVETGAVRVGDSVIIHAGEQLTITDSGAWKRGPNRDRLYGYYLGRPLSCINTPLRRLIDVLNRADDRPIVLGQPGLGDLPLTTVFKGGKSPDRILEIVALTFRLSIVRQGSTIILHK